MAHQYNQNIDPSFINDLPIEIVTSFLIAKGVVMTRNEADHLYKVTNVATQGH